MKIVHFTVWGPNRCGLYGTVRDLILAERSAGLDAEMCVLSKDNAIESGRRDGSITSIDESVCKKADVFVRHSAMPPQMQTWGVPIVMAMHGRPESSFRLERDAGNEVVTAFYQKARDCRYKAFITFWPEYMLPWSFIIPKSKLFYVPAPVDLDHYATGDDLELPGDPRILIADIWRDDVTPFNCIWGAVAFARKYAPNTKIYIVGLSGKKEWSAFRPFQKGLEKSGLLGQCVALTPAIRDWYASCDMLVSPHVIATRSIREALASGLPVVAGTGCKYTPFTANPMDIGGLAEAIHECYVSPGAGEAARRMAERNFKFAETAKAMQSVICHLFKPRTNQVRLFIHIGSDSESIVRQFYRQVDDASQWTIHCFEPDAEKAKVSAQALPGVPNLSIHPAMLGISDGTDYNGPKPVQMIDLDAWLKKHPADSTVIHMDLVGDKIRQTVLARAKDLKRKITICGKGETDFGSL